VIGILVTFWNYYQNGNVGVLRIAALLAMWLAVDFVVDFMSAEDVDSQHAALARQF
jgi:hypothetical protein